MTVLRTPTPSEWVIIKAIDRFWKTEQHPHESFNMAISRAAHACGVSYERAEWIARRTLGHTDSKPSDWLFPAGGR